MSENDKFTNKRDSNEPSYDMTFDRRNSSSTEINLKLCNIQIKQSNGISTIKYFDRNYIFVDVLLYLFFSQFKFFN